METYISLLPGDLRNELKTIEIYQTPYPEVLEICGKLCDDPNFWLRKAATETQEVYKNPEFTKFFNDYPGHIDIEKYIRVLAYDGKVVPDATIKGRYYPGSDILVGLPEIFRHGLKDPVILEYAFRILKTIIIDSNLYEEIVSLLITSRNIELLIKFFQEAIFSNHLNGGGPLYVPLLYLGYPKKRY